MVRNRAMRRFIANVLSFATLFLLVFVTTTSASDSKKKAPYHSSRCAATLMVVGAEFMRVSDFAEAREHTQKAVASLDGFLASADIKAIEVVEASFVDREFEFKGKGNTDAFLYEQELNCIAIGVGNLKLAYKNRTSMMRALEVRGHEKIVAHLAKEQELAGQLDAFKLNSGRRDFWEKLGFIGANFLAAPAVAAGSIFGLMQMTKALVFATEHQDYIQQAQLVPLLFAVGYVAQASLKPILSAVSSRDHFYWSDQQKIVDLLYANPEARPWIYRAEEISLS